VLINRNFTLLWAGQTLSEIGDYAIGTTLSLWIGVILLRESGDAPLAVSGIAAVTALATMLVGPIAGVFADRWNKRRTLMAADLVRALLMLAAVLVVSRPSPAHDNRTTLLLLYAIVLAATVAAQFFNPARFALIQSVVPSQDQNRAAAIGQSTHAIAVIAGPPLAAPLLYTAGIQWALALNAASFLVSCALVRAVRPPHRQRPGEPLPGSADRAGLAAEFADGLRVVARSGPLKALIVAVVLGTTGITAFTTLGVFFVTEDLHAAPQWFGILEGVLGLGLVAGVLTATRLTHHDPHRLFAWGLLATGTGLAIGANCSGIHPALAVMFLVGIPLAVTYASFTPIIVQAAPPTHLGRVTALINPVERAAALLGATAAGWLAHDSPLTDGANSHGVGGTLTLAAGLVLATGIYAVWSLPRAARTPHGQHSPQIP